MIGMYPIQKGCFFFSSLTLLDKINYQIIGVFYEKRSKNSQRAFRLVDPFYLFVKNLNEAKANRHNYEKLDKNDSSENEKS